MVSFLAFGLGRDQRKSGARAMHKLIGLAVVVLLAVGFAAALVFAWRNAAMIGEASCHLPSGIPEANRSAGRPGSLPFGATLADSGQMIDQWLREVGAKSQM